MQTDQNSQEQRSTTHDGIVTGIGGADGHTLGDIVQGNGASHDNTCHKQTHMVVLCSVVFQMVGGLRYSLGYCGARTIPELQEKAKVIRVTAAGLREAHPHDVTMLKDAPNYSSN